jgi:1-aminocyclopropane-1-carboxylate deaminase
MHLGSVQDKQVWCSLKSEIVLPDTYCHILLLPYTETPIVEISEPCIRDAGVQLFLKREDLNHPDVSGNKWWKLKYNLLEAQRLAQKTLLTFGGAYSNHLYATAAAAHACGFRSIGVVRGEEKHEPLNHTLSFAADHGMHLHFISRSEYRTKSDAAFIKQLHEKFGDFYLIPEGGTNELAIEGVAEWGLELNRFPHDYRVVAVGTAGTISGLITSTQNQRVIGMAVLKDGDFLRREIRKWTSDRSADWELHTQFHFGGYARMPPSLFGFIEEFNQKHRILLDPVYTGKMMAGVYTLIAEGYFPRGSRILALHTGGLQGWGGYSLHP